MKPNLAQVMARLSETREYRDKIKQIKKVASDTSASRRHILMHMPKPETIEMLQADGFEIKRFLSIASEQTYTVNW